MGRVGLRRLEYLMEALSADLALGGGTTLYGYKRKVEDLTVAKTLVAADSGKVFTIDADSGAYDITLPANSTSGFWATFVMKDIAGNNIRIVAATSDTIQGLVIDASPTAITLADVITFIGGTCLAGDMVEIKSSDGTSWYAVTYSGANGGITASG